MESKIDLNKKTLIFLSDGSPQIARAVGETFNKYIHIRQIHNPEARGIVLITVKDQDTMITVRLRWDILVEGCEDEPIHDLAHKDDAEVYKGMLNTAIPNEKTRKKRLIARGSIWRLAGVFNIVETVLAILLALFAGKFITSNVLEGKASAKSRLATHRTVKSGRRIIRVVVLCLGRPPDRGFRLDFRYPAGYTSAMARLTRLLISS